MTKEVIITIRGLQFIQSEEDMEPVEVVTPGEYYKKNGQHYLLFEEAVEGFEGTTHNVMKFKEDQLEVRKKGLVNVHMVFERGKKNMTFYTTPFGTLQMVIVATGMELNESDNNINMKVDYALDMNEEHVADCYLSVQAQPADSKDFVL